MRAIVTFEGIDEALENLRYNNKRALKYKLVYAIREQYRIRGEVASVKEIDTDFLVKSLWDTGDDPSVIRNRRKNFNSIKSTVNADLKKLYEEGKNSEGIIIGQKNVFDMSDEAKSEMLEAFSYGEDGGNQMPLSKIADVLNVINDFISNKDNSLENDDKYEQLKEIIKEISGKVGITIDTSGNSLNSQKYSLDEDGTGTVARGDDDSNGLHFIHGTDGEGEQDVEYEYEYEEIPEDEFEEVPEDEIEEEPVDESEDDDYEEIEVEDGELEDIPEEAGEEEIGDSEFEEVPEAEIEEEPVDESEDDDYEEIEVEDGELEDIPEEAGEKEIGDSEFEEVPEDEIEEELVDEFEADDYEDLEVEDAEEDDLEEIFEEDGGNAISELEDIEELPEDEFEEVPEEEIAEELVDESEADDYEDLEVEDAEEDDLEEILEEDGGNAISELEDIEELPEDEFEEVPEEEIAEELVDESEADDYAELEVEDAVEDDLEEILEEDGGNAISELEDIEELPEDEFEEVPEEEIAEELVDEAEADDYEELEVEDAEDDDLEEIIEDDVDEEIDDSEVEEIVDLPEEEFEEELVDEPEEDNYEEVELEDAKDDRLEEIIEDDGEEDLEDADIEEIEDHPEDEFEDVPEEDVEEELVDELEDDDYEEIEVEDAEDSELEEIVEDDLEGSEIEEIEELSEDESEGIPEDDIAEEPVDELEDDDYEEIEIIDVPDDENDSQDEVEDAKDGEFDDTLEEILDDYDASGYTSEEGRQKALLLADKFDKMLSETERYYNRYLLIPGGKYLTGYAAPDSNEIKEGYTQLPDFYFGKFPVTNHLFELFIEKTGYVTTAERTGYGVVYKGRYRNTVDEESGMKTLEWNSALENENVKGACWFKPEGPGSSLHGKRNHPVVQVSLEDAMAFAAWTGKRLPTEEEWEAASRTARGFDYPWGQEMKEGLCNIEASAIGSTTPVDEFEDAANNFGVYDLIGNVLEWTSTGDSVPDRSIYVTKGGSWVSGENIRLTQRFLLDAKTCSNILGFRCIAYK